MTWTSLPNEVRETAERVLTPRQLTVFRHRINGHSWRTIATALDIHEATVRGHHRAALDRLAHQLERKDAA